MLYIAVINRGGQETYLNFRSLERLEDLLIVPVGFGSGAPNMSLEDTIRILKAYGREMTPEEFRLAKDSGLEPDCEDFKVGKSDGDNVRFYKSV